MKAGRKVKALLLLPVITLVITLAVIDEMQYHRAVEHLNNATSQIMCIIGQRFCLQDFQGARTFRCWLDLQSAAHFERIQ